MNKGGAPFGNKNAAKSKSEQLFRDVLNYELAAVGRRIRKKREEIGETEPGDSDGALLIGWRHLAKRLIKSALNEDSGSVSTAAIREIADRVDGKPTAAIELSGRDGGPIKIEGLTIKLIKPGQQNDDGEED